MDYDMIDKTGFFLKCWDGWFASIHTLRLQLTPMRKVSHSKFGWLMRACCHMPSAEMS